MSTIHKAIVRSYNAGTHTASVQLTGSLAHYLAGIRVATNIPAAAVVAGRECTVLALDPNNPTDALVLSIQGALPPAGGGGASTYIQDADADTYVRAEQAADEDKVRMAVGGTERFVLQAAAPHLTLHDYVRVDERLGIATDPVATAGLKMRPAFSGVSGNIYLLDFSPASLSLNGATFNVDGVHADAIFNVSGYNVSRVAGLYFFGYVLNNEGDTLSDLMAVYARVGNQAMTGAMTRAAGLHVETPAWIGETYPTTYYGLRIKNPWTSGDGTTAVGILCEDPTDAAALYTAWLGADLSGTPKLRLDAGNPAANNSQLWLMVNNGAAVLRRVEIGAAGSGGAGYRMLRVLN